MSEMPKTRIFLTIVKKGSETLGPRKLEEVMEKIMENHGMSWNLKSSKEFEP